MYFSFTDLKLLDAASSCVIPNITWKKSHPFFPDTRRDARVFQKSLPSRRLRHLLPLQEGLSGKIFISARSVAQQLRQRLKVSILCNYPAFERHFKHRADIDCCPRRGFFAHLFLKRIHVLTGVSNLLAEHFAPDRC